MTVALREPLDQVQLTSFAMRKSIPKGETGIESEVDAIVRRIARKAGAKPSRARAVEYGQARGYQYKLSYPASEELELSSRLTFLFGGKTQITINCQSTDENRKQLADGCNEILNSLKLD